LFSRQGGYYGENTSGLQIVGINFAFIDVDELPHEQREEQIESG
jgi:hypothetical protein